MKVTAVHDFFLTVCDTEVPSVLYLHMLKVSSGLIVVFKIYDSKSDYNVT